MEEFRRRQDHHPLGISSLATDKELARAKELYPAEMKACLERFAEWRALLLASLPKRERGG